MALIYITLTTNDIECLFLCVLAICISSLVKHLLISFDLFYNWVACPSEF